MIYDDDEYCYQRLLKEFQSEFYCGCKIIIVWTVKRTFATLGWDRIQDNYPEFKQRQIETAIKFTRFGFLPCDCM